MAAWSELEGDLDSAERALELAVEHSAGAMAVRRQLFLLRHRAGRHRAALAALGITEDRPSGVTMFRGLDDDEVAALAARISASAARIQWWAAAEAYCLTALEHLDAEEDAERVRVERARLSAIRIQLDRRRALAAARPWIRRSR